MSESTIKEKNIKEKQTEKEKQTIEYLDKGLFYLRELTEEEWKDYWKYQY